MEPILCSFYKSILKDQIFFCIPRFLAPCEKFQEPHLKLHSTNDSFAIATPCIVFFSNQIDLGTSLRNPFTKSQQVQISLDVVVQHVSNSCKKKSNSASWTIHYWLKSFTLAFNVKFEHRVDNWFDAARPTGIGMRWVWIHSNTMYSWIVQWVVQVDSSCTRWIIVLMNNKFHMHFNCAALRAAQVTGVDR